MKEINTHNTATAIVERFDDLLCENGIKVLSPDDAEREEDNEAALYGETYSNLVDDVEAILIRLLNDAGIECTSYVFSGKI